MELIESKQNHAIKNNNDCSALIKRIHTCCRLSLENGNSVET